jgi:conjugal transfer/entry exclusion protein
MCTQSLGLDADRLRSDLDRASRAAEASEAARVKAAQETANQLAELQKKADEKLAFVVAAAEQAKKEASNRQAALEQVKDLRVKALKTKKYDR